MKRLWKYVKFVLAGAVLIVTARSVAGETHNQADPVFCLPRLGGGTTCSPIPGYELIGGFGG